MELINVDDEKYFCVLYIINRPAINNIQLKCFTRPIIYIHKQELL